MKKRIALLLAAVMALSLAACAPAAADPTSPPPSAPAQQSEAPTPSGEPAGNYGPGLGGTTGSPYIITAGNTAPNTTRHAAAIFPYVDVMAVSAPPR